MLFWLAAAALSAPAGGETSTAPRPTPAAFVSAQYGLTFRTPRSVYCPLPRDWVGSDHGTVIFLSSPGRCHGAGYPSSGRGFGRNVPRIEIFYAYALETEDAPPETCKTAGRVRFLGRNRPLCQSRRNGLVELSVSARYRTETEGEAIFRLVTTPERMQRDLKAFRSLLVSTRTCTATWHGGKSGSFTTGSGPACPKGARFF